MKLMIRLTLLLSFLGSVSSATDLNSVPGEFVVKLKDSLSSKSSQEILSEKLKSFVKTTIPKFNAVVIKRPVFELPESVLKSLGKNEYVDLIEPNFEYKAQRAPNDPMFGLLWGLRNNGQMDSDQQEGILGIDISAEKAWDLTIGSKDIVVAVIDTGVDFDHPDLKNSMWINKIENEGTAGVDDDGNGVVDDIYGVNLVDAENPTGNPLDDNGHGTHCSGILGASGNNGTGVVGVAWNLQIMAIKFLSAQGAGTLEGALKGIEYAIKMKARVLSNSWGGGSYSEILKEAIEETNRLGMLFVAAAGNEGNDNDATPLYPSSYKVENIISVAAIDNRGKLAPFSNYGKSSVHVGAPGVNINSTLNNGGYESWSGTSMAAPFVSGLSVLLLAKEPKLTNLEIKSRIVGTSKPVVGLRGRARGGLVDAFNMLTNTNPPPDLEDPANWAFVSFNISTAHPYSDKTKESYQLQVPGAHQISIYFEKFETERDFDVVTIFNSQGEKVAEMSGRNNGIFSQIIEGDSATIEFSTDDSITRYGFDISKVAWR